MDMFSKLKSAVSSALPGNPLSKDFEVYGQVCTAGPGLLWKVYSGIKKTTKQDAAVFVFEKKSIEKYSKRDKELIVEALKRGVSQLTRLRHPKILSVIQPLEESRETLAFATEPVLASLANVLGNYDNLPESVAKELKEHQLYEVEIKYGLLQVTEALQFLHNDAKLLHNNVCPDSIIINKNGSWKLAGFDFCVPNQNPPEQAPLFPFKDWDPGVVPCAQPHLDYLAPEYAISESCSLACDMFSMGVVIYAMFNNGKPLYECNNQYGTFKKNAEELRKWRGSLLGKIPSELQEIVKLLLNTEPTVRPDPDQLAKVNFFEDVGSMTLQYMDSLFQQENLQKSKFFKGLPKIIAKFPKRVNLQRMLPPLFKECVNPDMIPFVLPNILQIAEQATDKEYTTLILPELIPMFKLTSPVQILLIFMQNMSLLLKKTPAAEIKTHVLPMIYRALETNSSQIQELCLSIIPTFAELLDYTSLKNSIIPRIKKLCLSTSVVGVRVNCLVCVGKLLEVMDKWFVLDEVLPLLPQVPSKEPAVLMSILGIYKVAFTHSKLGITKDILAGKVIPFLVTISVENTLNLSQFTAYMRLIREMIDKVESEHRSKLEQLEQIKQEQKSMEITKITEHDDSKLIVGLEEKPKTMMDNFLSGLGMTGTSSGTKSSGDASKPAQSAAPSQPTKVTLTLEEKQRIAKQQEQQRYLNAAKPLESKSFTSANQSKPKQPPARDLTASLMNSNMASLSSSTSKPASVAGTTALSMNNGMGAGSMGNRNGHGSMNSAGFGSFPVPSATSSFSQNTISQGQGNRSVDLSSFDNLLTSSSQKPKMSMNQMNQAPMSSSNTYGMLGNMNSHNSFMGNQGMMGGSAGQGMLGNQSMMGNNGMMGAGFGGQSQMINQFGGQTANQGLNGNMNFAQMNPGNVPISQPMGGQNLMQPFQSGKQIGSTASAKDDLNDLFG